MGVMLGRFERLDQKKEGIRIDIKTTIQLMPIENDFVCPKCGNDKYSQLEYNNKIACWMCGELG